MARKPETQAAYAMRTKRLTIEIPADLHQRIKLDSVIKGQNMADALRALILKEWPPRQTRATKERTKERT